MKVPLTNSIVRRGLAPTADLLAHLRPSYDDFGILALLSDAFAIILASALTGIGYHWLAFGRFANPTEFVEIGVSLAVLAVVLTRFRGLYAPDALLLVRPQIKPIIFIWASVILFLLGVSFALKISAELSRGAILSLAVVAPCLIVAQRVLLRRAMIAVLKSGRLRRRKVILINGDPRLPDDVLGPPRAYDVVGKYELPSDREGVQRLLQGIVSRVRGSDDISEIHVATEWNRLSGLRQILAELRALPLPVRLIPDTTAREILQYPHHTLGGTVSFEVQRPPLTTGERAAKRLFDVAAATIALLIMAPLLLVVALAVRLESPGPIIFRQARGGFNGRAFQVLKFRTMRVMEDGPEVRQATLRDDRVTRVGRWLRRWSIDELPQLINVLQGDMSLVGPRPHALAHDRQYSALISNYPFRHHVKPGITGWAQVNGYRGETATIDPMMQRVELDLWYLGNWSFWLDLRILFWTALEVFRRRNAF